MFPHKKSPKYSLWTLDFFFKFQFFSPLFAVSCKTVALAGSFKWGHINKAGTYVVACNVPFVRSMRALSWFAVTPRTRPLACGAARKRCCILAYHVTVFQWVWKVEANDSSALVITTVPEYLFIRSFPAVRREEAEHLRSKAMKRESGQNVPMKIADLLDQ